MPKRSRPSARPGTTSRKSSASRASRPGAAAAPSLRPFEKRLRLRFADSELLDRALTHSSYAHEHAGEGVEHNERLEFLGDAVLELVVANLLYQRDLGAREGEMTTARAALVSTGALAQLGRRIGLGAHLRLGRGVERSGGRELDSVLGNAVEALFGAIYLDQGLAAAEKVFKALTREPVAEVANYKGILQEVTQAEGRGVPAYRVLEASGPSHRRLWSVAAEVDGSSLGEGSGATRRAAEQEAARHAVEQLQRAARRRGRARSAQDVVANSRA